MITNLTGKNRVIGGIKASKLPSMEKKNNRPIYLNLLKIRLPIGGVVSIIHRITGVLLVLLLVPVLYALQTMLHDQQDFAAVTAWISTIPGRLIVLALFWFLTQHLLSGLRHMFISIDIGVELPSARGSAWTTLVLSIGSTLILGLVLL